MLRLNLFTYRALRAWLEEPYETPPMQNTALMLVAARLRHIASTKWGTRKYMDMERLYALERDKEVEHLPLTV